jgi:hypothetical protein
LICKIFKRRFNGYQVSQATLRVDLVKMSF